MTVEKWKILGGKVFKLARAFDNPLEAIELAKELKVEKQVFLHRSDSGTWAVYWRKKEDTKECPPKLFSVAHNGSGTSIIDTLPDQET